MKVFTYIVLIFAFIAISETAFLQEKEEKGVMLIALRPFRYILSQNMVHFRFATLIGVLLLMANFAAMIAAAQKDKTAVLGITKEVLCNGVPI